LRYPDPVQIHRKTSRFKALPERERGIGLRLAYLRKLKAVKQSRLAELLGITRDQIANVESGRVPMRAKLGWDICRLFDIDPNWLLTGHWGLPGERPFPPADKPWLGFVERVISKSNASFFDLYSSVGWLLGPDAPGKEMLTHVSESANLSAMKSPLAHLRERLKRATAAKGKKAELAHFLGVPRPCVSDWLSGKREPGGETTLRLLNWVERQEAQQTTRPAEATTPAGLKTRKKAPNEKKPQSNPP
jgi:transcriptional regulator with XRE-family HTH domain